MSTTPTADAKLKDLLDVLDGPFGWKADLEQLMAAREQEAERRGLERAKARVLRRTEIPRDAKNPTRDATVILGEQIADIIQHDIDQLTNPKKEDK